MQRRAERLEEAERLGKVIKPKQVPFVFLALLGLQKQLLSASFSKSLLAGDTNTVNICTAGG